MKYLVFERENNITEEVDTVGDAMKLADELIRDSLEDGLWPEWGPQVYIYELKFEPQKVDVVKREDVDKDEADSWPGEAEYQCDYRMIETVFIKGEE